MARLSAYINNAIAQLFDEIEDKCDVKFATFTASDLQGQKTLATGTRTFMENDPNNSSNGIYKYLYDPNLSFDFRFHQRLAAAPFVKTSKPWATIMFSTKQAQSLSNILSHLYTEHKFDEGGNPYELKLKRVRVPVNMVVVSNDMTKLYYTTEKMSMYFDRFINYHYDHVIDVGDPENGGFQIFESKVGQAANIKEVNLDKYETTSRGSLVAQAYTFDLVYFAVKNPGTTLRLLKKIILEVEAPKGNNIATYTITEDGTTVD